ncbi:M48 family metallopeptidase [Candidatus Peregrinibacteria bacterium]|nr:M48 family metallopeptidase [Candidatus Peregrinibacteria bacterium]
MPDQKFTISIAGEEVKFTLSKRLGTRNLRLRLDQSKRLYISAPRFMSTRRIVEFLEEKQHWLKRNLEKIEEKNKETAASSKQFRDGEVFNLLGEKYHLDLRFTQRKYPKAYFECTEAGNNMLILELHEDTAFRELAEIGRETIEKLYRKYAKEHFTQRLEELNAEYYGFKYGDIRVKNQRTRFGSCSSKRNLNFNWRVIMAPRKIVDYLLIHELCHTKEMNHSKKFWDLVEHACPNYKAHRTWLKKRGHVLAI